MEAGKTVRLIAVGSELLAGHGDQCNIGWLGRVLARTPREERGIEPYILARPGETTEGLANRWLEETRPRMSNDIPNFLLVSLSEHDLHEGLSPARSRLFLAHILDKAAELGVHTLVVGPPPINAAEELTEYNAAFKEVCTRRQRPYIDTFTPLLQHEQWRGDITATDGRVGQAGHGLIAWLLLHRGWYQWLGLTPPQ